MCVFFSAGFVCSFAHSRNVKNPLIPNAWPHGYVLKIINTLDSKKEKFFDAQTQMLLYLRQQAVECPKPVMNIYGKYHKLVQMKQKVHLVRLLEFLPGEMLVSVPKSQNLFYQAGEYVALIDKSLKRFTHEGLETRRSLWMIDAFPEVSKFLYAVEDAVKQAIVQQVLDAFEKQVVPNLGSLAKGVIHGDFNEHNILVRKNDVPDEYRISGLIDFGDSCVSHYVYELAIALVYMMLQTSDLETGGFVIAGYEMVRPIPDKEKEVLKVNISDANCRRICALTK